MRRLVLLVIAVTLFSGSVAQAASYQKTDGTIVDPIMDTSKSTHPYAGLNLAPSAVTYFANLSNAYLKDADLLWADLSWANLSGADLRNAMLAFSNLTVSNLTNADLQHANLYGAQMENTNLEGADLTGANLTEAYLKDATLEGANLTDAYLFDADLYRADLYGVNLESADLRGANLSYTNLYRADLSYADLAGADLTNAYVAGAFMEFTSLYHADLWGTNLTGAHHLYASSGSPYYYPNTTLPSGFDPVAEDWNLAPYCDFTPDAACDLADINQMFQAGNLVTGVTVYNILFWGNYTPHRLDLVNNDTLDAADISEWLSQAATANGFGSAYLRGDTDLDRDIDLTDYNALVNNFDPLGIYGPYLWQHGNSDGDNDIDLSDYNALASNFQPLGYGAAAVPEPTSVCLLLTALLVLARVRF